MTYRCLVSTACAVMLLPIAVAQTPLQPVIAKIDETALTQLYGRQLQNPDEEYTQTRITDERAKIRAQLEEEVRTQLQAAQETIDLTGEELTSALERARSELTATEDRLKSRRLDLENLAKEEQQFYMNGTDVQGTGSVLRLTTSHAELLAQRAILEERITVLEGLKSLQQERVDSLTFDQRLEQFRVVILVGKYVLILLVIMLIERTIRSVLLRSIRNRDRRYSVTKIFTSTVYIITTLWLLTTIFSRQPSILASLAIVGAGLAISLQDMVKDILGWFSIHRNQLFSKGDRVGIGMVTGEVIDIGMFYTTLLEVGVSGNDVLERTGKTLLVPNNTILTQPVINHNTTSDFVRAETTFDITFESNWRRAEEILKEILTDVTQQYAEQEQLQYGIRTRQYYIPHAVGTPTVHLSIGADGVTFTLRFTVPIGQRRPVASEITRRVLSAFDAEPDIDHAYKTSRVISTPVPPPVDHAPHGH